jgi:ferrochelatase
VEREGDIYQQHMEDCVQRIVAELPSDVKVHLSYQSKVGPVEWLKPYTDSKIEELADAGVKNLIVVPISFVSEHIETLVSTALSDTVSFLGFDVGFVSSAGRD